MCGWLCLAPSSPDSLTGKLRAESILLFIPVSHTVLTITIYRHGPWESSELTCLCLFPFNDMNPMECLILFYFKLSVVLSRVVVPLNSWLQVCVETFGRAADKMQTGQQYHTSNGIFTLTALSLFQEHCV